MALHSPEVYAQIVDSYIDGYRKRGWMPDCRANNLPGWTQGGWLFPLRCFTLAVRLPRTTVIV
jgi:putative alpha-1,2-mannosidase